LKFTGKILIFKSLNVDSDEALDEFLPVPSNLTFAQGVEMLRKERDRFTAKIESASPAKQP